jgi:CYTH domain-containing protein
MMTHTPAEQVGIDMADGIEIERKFLLDELPPVLAFARRRAILQGYLAIDGDTEVRVRRTPAGSTLTIKHGSGEVRVEEELALGERQADALWELTNGRRLQKVRRVMRLDGFDVEVDEYAGALDGLVVAEVEFVDEETSRGFEPPALFGREVTGEAAYANRNLAMFGLPADKPA